MWDHYTIAKWAAFGLASGIVLALTKSVWTSFVHSIVG